MIQTTPVPIAELEDQVAFWDARLRSPLCTDEDRTAFAAWRDADPAHGAAFARFEGYLEQLQDAYRTSPELRAWRDQALRARPGHVTGWRPWAIAAGLVAVLGGGAALAVMSRSEPPASVAQAEAAKPAVFQTAMGERSTVTLSDGSKATLDTDSRIDVTYEPKTRGVRVVRGQVLFAVAKDPSRPFVVKVADQSVTAVGTQFNIRMDADKVSVTMVEGKVRVDRTRPGAGSAPSRSLVAGEQLVASKDGEIQVRRADVAGATNWSDGRVLFEDTPLFEAVAEINRYSPVPVRIADKAVGRLRVSGMVRTDEPLNFVRALPGYFAVRLQSRDGQLVLYSEK